MRSEVYVWETLYEKESGSDNLKLMCGGRHK